MSTKPRTVRFSDSEEKKIQGFLKINPFLDFSSLARIAIEQFMISPNLAIHPIPEDKLPSIKNKKKNECEHHGKLSLPN